VGRKERRVREVGAETLARAVAGFVDDAAQVPHRSTPRVVASGNAAVPFTTLAIIDKVVPAYRLNMLNAARGIPSRDGVVHETSFVGAGMRRSPSLAYIPSRLSMVPALWRTALPPDMVVLHTSLPRDGRVSLGVEVNVLPAAVEQVRARGGLVVAQMNPRMPYTFGDGELDVDRVDLALEVDEALGVHAPGLLDEASRVIGERVAALVPEGATLQTGIGAVPDAALAGLSSRRGLRVWSEMFSDGVLALERAGALDAQVPLTASFLVGSEQLYTWVDGNERVRLRRTEVANDPAVIARQPAMTSVNTALQVDLFGQVNASRIGERIHSGFGGATDFLVGALHSHGGQALVALRSWHPKADVSTIVALLDQPATSFQPSAVVTERGVAPVWGRDEREQAEGLIELAAHPRVRDELREELGYLGLL
jgi:acyl-CoA hydrolase